MPPIHHDPAAGRFTTTADGQEARLDYQLQNEGWMVIRHTAVPAAIAGSGLASRLTRAAFDHARGQGWKVRPVCTYAAGWAERHPEYLPLLG